MRALVALALLLAACTSEEPVPWEESAAHLRFDPALGDGFWSFPFPSDLRTVDGHPDLADFPNPGGSDLLQEYADYGTATLDGFGLNAPVWLSFDAPVAAPAWSGDAAQAAMRCEGPILLIDLTAGSPHRGECLPLRWSLTDPRDPDPFQAQNQLAVAPYWGFPMRSASTYGVLVSGLLDPSGAHVAAPAGLAQALRGEGDPALVATYAPLAAMIAERPELVLAEAPGEEASWVAAASVFTTQDALEPMRRLADFVQHEPGMPTWTGELARIREANPHYMNNYDIYDGAYTAWNFQEGELPYASSGGGFVWDGDRPVPQWEERVPFAIGMPLHGREMPAAGWPVVIHGHGTGGDRFSHINGGGQTPGVLAGSRDMMSFCIPQPFHGDRWPEGSATSIDLYSFNISNPESGRSTFRQAALDTLAAVRFVRENLGPGGPIAEAHPDLRIDPDRIYYLGHSQGGITGAIALPFAENVRAWALSGAGGGLTMTLLQREDPFVIRDLLATALSAGEETVFHEEHPAIGLIQTLAEATDPVNYAPLWVRESEGVPVSVLLTEGTHDQQTPPDSSEALATAGGLPIARPYKERDVFGLELRGLDPERAPYSGNVAHPSGVEVTAGLGQFDSNHFAIFNRFAAGALWSNFLYSQVRDGAPGELGGDYP